MPDFFGPTLLYLAIFLFWSWVCFWAGYSARGDEDITKFIEKLTGRPPDDPPMRV